MRVPAILVVAAVAVLPGAVGGCAGDSPPSEEQTTEAPPATEGEMRVAGEVVTGVEPGCLLLDTGEKRYLLLGGDRDRFEPGEPLTVVGHAAPGDPTTCMEGIPFEVSEIVDS